MKYLTLLLVFLYTNIATAETFSQPSISNDPQGYLCMRTMSPMKIDGHMDEKDWRDAPWVSSFVDIEGAGNPSPKLDTRVKLLWDDQNLYIAAELSEPHLCATQNKDDHPVEQDNCFTVFIDPDCDNHNYIELAINALNTTSDILLTRPPRDAGLAVIDWDMPNLRTAVALNGTLNEPVDNDGGWALEIALPWTAIAPISGKNCPPEDGERWRLNLLRKHWDLDDDTDQYSKVDRPEHNWVWSPQGLIDMHYPEMWGVLEFRDAASFTELSEVIAGPVEKAKWSLMQLYYQQKVIFAQNGEYGHVEGMDSTTYSFHASRVVAGMGQFHIDQSGHIWLTTD